MGSNLVAKPIVKARTRRRLAPSKVSGLVVFAGRIIAPAYLRLALSFRGVEVLRPEELTCAMEAFQQGRTRLIVSFRHAYGDEPQLLFHALETLAMRNAKKLRRPLKRGFSMRPVHDYAVALWGGAAIRFILPRTGALPVYHTKLDSQSLNHIRSVMRDGPHMLGIAPEGQISYHAETLPRIEQGAVRMGLWCARDLEKAGRPEHVDILPLSIHYRYDVRDMGKIRSMLARVEKLCGMEKNADDAQGNAPERMLHRIDALETRMLEMTEAYYQSTYGYRPAEPEANANGSHARHDRWMALLPFAITVAEQLLGLEALSADTVQRMYRVRQAGWDRIYPESPVEALCTLEQALADRRAGEAWHAMRHMELVDLMGYHDPDYLNAETYSFDRVVETVLTLADLAARLMGGNITNRPNTIRKRAVIVPGARIDLTEALPQYHAHAKQTVQTLTETLAGRFGQCIEVYKSETT